MDAAQVPAQDPDQHVPADTGDVVDGLTQRDRAILAFERQWWQYPGLKGQAIHELIGVSPTRYYQLVNRLIDKRAALEADPMLVKRLRRLRSGRQRARSAPRLSR